MVTSQQASMFIHYSLSNVSHHIRDWSTTVEHKQGRHLTITVFVVLTGLIQDRFVDGWKCWLCSSLESNDREHLVACTEHQR